ncbi:hypothetical protein CVPH_1159 [Abyssogena phaseoliformis symbiont OG214]|nr:hypothetical protein CVPH_1159 [Abyssogena phaseoliformis symbiont OG214]
MLKYFPQDIVIVIAMFIVAISLAVKIVHSLPYIEEFRERRSKSKAKKIEQTLRLSNLSEDVQVYLQDKLISEYFYHATGILASPKNIDRVINIHNGDNDIKDFYFRCASQYADYLDLDIEVNLSKFDKFNYYFNIFSSVFFLLFWMPVLVLSFLGIFDLRYQYYIFLLIASILFPILAILMLKDVRAYKGARKIQQYLKSQTKEK